MMSRPRLAGGRPCAAACRSHCCIVRQVCMCFDAGRPACTPPTSPCTLCKRGPWPSLQLPVPSSGEQLCNTSSFSHPPHEPAPSNVGAKWQGDPLDPGSPATPCRPARADLVATVGETFGDAAIRRMRDRMRGDPDGRRILAERPHITVRRAARWAEHRSARHSLCPHAANACSDKTKPRLILGQRTELGTRLGLLLLQGDTVAPCWDMPPGTFGGEYARFMGSRGFQADDRPPVRCD
jgi:hypothetical protein